jgi:hypothetical protein
MFALTDTSHQTEVADLKRIEKSRTLSPAGDSILTTTTVHYFTDDNTLKEIATHIVHKNGSAPRDEARKEVVLGKNAYWTMIGLVLIQVVLVTMVYGPIAAFLVELFPTRIRYTSMSLPYHIGNGIFGGLVPFIATSLYEASKSAGNPGGDPFAGLWYPIAVAAICFVIGMIFLPNRKVADVVD